MNIGIRELTGKTGQEFTNLLINGDVYLTYGKGSKKKPIAVCSLESPTDVLDVITWSVFCRKFSSIYRDLGDVICCSNIRGEDFYIRKI